MKFLFFPSSTIIALIIFSVLFSSSLFSNETDPEEPELTPVLESEHNSTVTKTKKPTPSNIDTATLTDVDPNKATAIRLLDKFIEPDSFRTLNWAPGFSMSSLNTPVPVLIAHGVKPGKVLCLTAAIHGDELNGIEIVRRVLHDIDTSELTGTVIGMPIVNLDGFRRSSRYMSDRRDLNRYFPGNPRGSYASRVAYSLFHDVIKHCNYLIDIHTGSFKRANVPQIRGDLKNDSILEFTRHFGGLGVLHHPGGTGTLRRSAADYGIPAITIEAGGPLVLENEAVLDGVKGVKNALHNLDMYKSMRLWLMSQPVFYQSSWVRSKQGGILLSTVELDETVDKGQLLGRVVDPITNTSSDILSPYKGKVLGKAIDQVVSPGFATFHIGMVSSEEQLAKPLPRAVREITTNNTLNADSAVPSLVTPTPTIDVKNNIPTVVIPNTNSINTQTGNNLNLNSGTDFKVDQLPATPLNPIDMSPIDSSEEDDMGS